MANSCIDMDFGRIDLQRLVPDSEGIRAFRNRRLERSRRSWIYIASAGFFCLGVLSVAAAMREDRFVAKAIILAPDAAQSHPGAPPFLSKVPELVLHRVVKAEGLADDPEFVPQQWKWIARAGLVFGWNNFASGNDANLGHAVSSLERAVSLKPLPQEGLEVAVASIEASKAARIADSLAEALVEDQKEQAAEKATQSRKAAADAVADFGTRLQTAQQRLANAQTQQDQDGDMTASIGARAPGDAAAAVAEAKGDVDRIAHALATGQTASLNDLHFPTPDLDRLAAQYDELRQQFEKRKLTLGDKHPELVALEGQLRALQKEIHGQWQKAADSANRNYRLAQARLLVFGRETRAASDTGPDALQAPIEKLQTDVDLARGDYEHALQLQAKAERSADSQPNWSMMRAQVPQSTTHDPRGFALGAVLMLGSMFGAGRTLAKGWLSRPRQPAAKKIDKKTDKKKAPEAAPGLFPIPRIRREWIWERLKLKPPLDAACQEVMDRPRSDFSRAIEHLFELETDAVSSRTMKVLCVSKEDKLGATTIAVNFAHVAAKAGHRVLLIEANRRRPVLASLISPNVRVNLIELNGAKRIICQLRPRLSVIPLFDEETESLLKARAHHIIKGISGHFDVVILDGGRFVQDDDEMMDMAGAVNRVFLLTPQGIECKPGGKAFGSRV